MGGLAQRPRRCSRRRAWHTGRDDPDGGGGRAADGRPSWPVVAMSRFARSAVDSPPVALTIGIVGLPNAGKSTLFNALTKNDVLAANYPFATIEPNVGVVGVPDDRLPQAGRDLRLGADPAGDRGVRRHRRHRPRCLGGGGAGQQVPLPHPRVRRDLPGDPGLPRRGRHPRRRRGRPGLGHLHDPDRADPGRPADRREGDPAAGEGGARQEGARRQPRRRPGGAGRARGRDADHRHRRSTGR